MHKIHGRLLAYCGKTYTPDPQLPVSFIVVSLLRRLSWLLRGLIRLQRPVFVGSHVTLDGRHNIRFGRHVTLDPFVWFNAVAQQPVVLGDAVRIGAYSRILCTAHFSTLGRGLTMGDHASCGEFCTFGAAGGITIGRHVMMGQYVSLHAQEHSHHDVTQFIQHQPTTQKGIIIGDGCWIGAKATILDGTTLGKHCVVAAGSVVKGDFPDYAVIAGVPGTIVKMRNA